MSYFWAYNRYVKEKNPARPGPTVTLFDRLYLGNHFMNRSKNLTQYTGCFFFILNKYILKLLGPQSTEEAGLGQNLFLRS